MLLLLSFKTKKVDRKVDPISAPEDSHGVVLARVVRLGQGAGLFSVPFALLPS